MTCLLLEKGSGCANVLWQLSGQLIMATTTITGTSGDDILFAADGNKFIGGNGTDALVFAGTIDDYAFSTVQLSNLKLTVTNTETHAVDDVRQIEWLQFDNAK